MRRREGKDRKLEQTPVNTKPPHTTIDVLLIWLEDAGPFVHQTFSGSLIPPLVMM